MNQKEELTFHPKYVAPFYMDLMKLNFLRKSDEEIKALFSSINHLSGDLSDEILIEMLNDSWRPSKVAAWVIGIAERTNLINELELFISEEGCYYSEHVLLNLLILRGRDSSQIIKKFIIQQVNFIIRDGNKYEVEKLSIDWAISILGYIDKEFETNNLNDIFSSKEWAIFVDELSKISYYDLLKPQFEPSYYEEEITSLLTKVKRG